MFQIKYEDVGDKTPNEVAWDNMKMADKNFHLQLFISSSLGWLKANPGKNFQNLEKELREKNFNTHLIAVKPREIPGAVLKLANEDNFDSDLEYDCLYSCRSKEDAIKELLQSSKSYDENFQKLAKTGSLVCSPQVVNIDFDDKGTDNRKLLNNKERLEMGLISDNKKKAIVTKLSPQEYISNIKNDLIQKHGNIQEFVIGLGQKGEPIFGFFKENNLVSKKGFMVRATQQGNQIIPITFS